MTPAVILPGLGDLTLAQTHVVRILFPDLLAFQSPDPYWLHSNSRPFKVTNDSPWPELTTGQSSPIPLPEVRFLILGTRD